MASLERSWLALGDDEEVLHWTHPSLFKFTGEIVFGFIMMIAGFYAIYLTHFGGIDLTGEMLKYAQYGSYTAVLLGFLFICITILEYFKQFYVITNERLISKTKIVNKNPDYIPLNKIQMTRIRQEKFGLEEFLGYGDIFISTAATAGEESSLMFVPKPYEFKKVLEKGEEYDEDDN